MPNNKLVEKIRKHQHTGTYTHIYIEAHKTVQKSGRNKALGEINIEIDRKNVSKWKILQS